MSREQRWAASGVVVLLGALWGGLALTAVSAPYRHDGPPDDSMALAWVFLAGLVALGLAGLWLFLGLLTVRRVESGSWRWWAPATLAGVVAVWSLVAAFSAVPDGPVWWAVLLGFQSLALLAWIVLLWTPAPVAAPHEGDA